MHLAQRPLQMQPQFDLRTHCYTICANSATVTGWQQLTYNSSGWRPHSCSTPLLQLQLLKHECAGTQPCHCYDTAMLLLLSKAVCCYCCRADDEARASCSCLDVAMLLRLC
jgi:hypothetical protein